MPLDMTTLGVTDEALAIEASADFPLIAPKDQKLAEGDDGEFDPSDRWTLSSGSADFAAQGVSAGSMFRLTFPIPGAGSGLARTRQVGLAVDSVAGGSVTFRRQGLAAGQGVPPGPADGATGVSYECLTLVPQVRAVAGRLKRRFSINVEADLKSTDDFNIAIICLTLADLYLTQSRMPGDLPRDAFAAKCKLYLGLANDAQSRLDLSYAEPSANSVVFSGTTRPSRDCWPGDGLGWWGVGCDERW